jgi:hypothetical protein
MLRVKKCFHTLIFGLASNPKFVRNEIRDIMYMGKNMEKQENALLKISKVSFQPFLFMFVLVRDGHGGGWSRKINAWHLYTLMFYL